MLSGGQALEEAKRDCECGRSGVSTKDDWYQILRRVLVLCDEDSRKRAGLSLVDVRSSVCCPRVDGISGQRMLWKFAL